MTEPADRTAAGEQVGERLTRIISLLVDSPRAVHVAARRGRDGTVFEVSVDPDDLGQLIGSEARTARALRTVLAVR